ncbi:Formin-like protein [Dorcoceras hygrometricum]|uniref:Formin-like protein n=1 Tax=Dorcoceras hygrometricum TaxID=472368 RepID=A0A2Z7CGF2_9LAMI|nr:Formin-like protein [Dorcoceras hygrometricum]
MMVPAQMVPERLESKGSWAAGPPKGSEETDSSGFVDFADRWLRNSKNRAWKSRLVLSDSKKSSWVSLEFVGIFLEVDGWVEWTVEGMYVLGVGEPWWIRIPSPDCKMSGRGRGRRGERRGSTIKEVSLGGPACVIVVITPPVEQLVRQPSQGSGHPSGQGPIHGNYQKGLSRKQKRQASQFRKQKSPKQSKTDQ